MRFYLASLEDDKDDLKQNLKATCEHLRQAFNEQVVFRYDPDKYCWFLEGSPSIMLQLHRYPHDRLPQLAKYIPEKKTLAFNNANASSFEEFAVDALNNFGFEVVNIKLEPNVYHRCNVQGHRKGNMAGRYIFNEELNGTVVLNMINSYGDEKATAVYHIKGPKPDYSEPEQRRNQSHNKAYALNAREMSDYEDELQRRDDVRYFQSILNLPQLTTVEYLNEPHAYVAKKNLVDFDSCLFVEIPEGGAELHEIFIDLQPEVLQLALFWEKFYVDYELENVKSISYLQRRPNPKMIRQYIDQRTRERLNATCDYEKFLDKVANRGTGKESLGNTYLEQVVMDIHAKNLHPSQAQEVANYRYKAENSSKNYRQAINYEQELLMELFGTTQVPGAMIDSSEMDEFSSQEAFQFNSARLEALRKGTKSFYNFLVKEDYDVVSFCKEQNSIFQYYLANFYVMPQADLTDGEHRIDSRDNLQYGDLLTPLCSLETGQVFGYQRIPLSGDIKLYLKGTQKNAHGYVLQDVNQALLTGSFRGVKPRAEYYLVCEGYATALAVKKIVEQTDLIKGDYDVVVAYDCGNLEPVINELLRINPLAKILLFADNDLNDEIKAIYPEFHDTNMSNWQPLQDVEGYLFKNTGATKLLEITAKRKDVIGYLPVHKYPEGEHQVVLQGSDFYDVLETMPTLLDDKQTLADYMNACLYFPMFLKVSQMVNSKAKSNNYSFNY